jgi:parvulin-like peptidyl-prolyl isomerase
MTLVKRISITFLCLTFAFSLTACSKSDRSPVIVEVNGRNINRADFEQFLAIKMGELNTADTSEALRSQMLDEYIVRQLVLESAAQASLSVTDSEIDQAALENPQVKSSAATADAREEMTNDLLIEKYYRQIVLRDVRISPEEIQAYVSENQSRLVEKPGYYVREIRVQSREEAERLRHEATEGKSDFATLARQHSDAPNAEGGGLARYEEDHMPDFLKRAVQNLRPGDVTPVIQSNFGFHLFQLDRRIQPRPEEERRPQYDEISAQLAEELTARKNQKAVDEAVDRLIAGAKIKIYDASNLGFTYTGRLRQN